jgi:hypothetical protein
MTLHELVDLVASELPDWWDISLTVTADSSEVELTDPDGKSVDFVPAYHEGVTRATLAALDHAIEEARRRPPVDALDETVTLAGRGK